MTKKGKRILLWCVLAAILVAASVTAGILLYQNHQKRLKAEENARLVREYYENKITTYEQENAENPNVDLVFLGDSLTDSCDLGKYYPEYSSFNRGISGDTSFGLLDRLEVSAYQTNPKAIVLLIGGNDILGGKSLESVYANYREIITGLQRELPQAKIVWCSLSAMGDRWAKYNDTARACNQTIRAMAKEYGCTYVDLFTPLYDESTGEVIEGYTIEGVHFSDAGFQVVSEQIKHALKNGLGGSSD